MVPGKLQSSRFELKYIVSEEMACAIRESIRIRLVPDAYSKPDGDGYGVNTLYLDSDGLELCNATVRGHKNRFKLRVRWYDEQGDYPYFIEIKRRVNDQILKRRAAVRLEAVHALLGGHLPNRDHLIDSSDGLDVLNEFCRLRNTLQASGAVYVRYDREAWVPEEQDVARVTFDRRLQGSPYKGVFESPEDDWACAQPRGTILELKFRDRFPGWMRRLVQDFNLNRCSVPKYVSCAASMHRYRGRLAVAYGEYD